MSYEEISEIYGNEGVYRSACEKIATIADIKEQCGRAGTEYDEDFNRITVIYLNRQYLLTLSNCQVSLTSRDTNIDEEINAMDKTLIAYYLTLAKCTPLSGRLVTYKQVPGGTHYFARFSQLAVQPLISHFGVKPELLIPAGEELGGKKINRGDAVITINAFSRIPVTIVLQKRDEEFAPTASVMFDSTISDYLPSEDIRILCEIITSKLISFS